jgi:hypothetical protein
LVLAAEKETGKQFINLPTQLLISSTKDTIESGKEPAVLKSRMNKFGNYELEGQKITWRLAPGYRSLAKLKLITMDRVL